LGKNGNAASVPGEALRQFSTDDLMRLGALLTWRRPMVTVERPHDADTRQHLRAAATAQPGISASIAVCHSGASCSAFGSLVITANKRARAQVRDLGVPVGG
jgi:hypothetical protein